MQLGTRETPDRPGRLDLPEMTDPLDPPETMVHRARSDQPEQRAGKVQLVIQGTMAAREPLGPMGQLEPLETTVILV